jgi:glycosyltransferase involved in cell wall biosynthesis
MARKRLAYVSLACFIDHEFPILKEFARDYKTVWYLLLSDGEKKYSVDDVAAYSAEHNIDLRCYRYQARFRNPKNLWFDARIVSEIRHTQPDIVYFESFWDPYFPFVAWLFLNQRRTIIGIHDVIPHEGPKNLGFRLHNAVIFTLFKNFHLFSHTQQRIFLERYRHKKSFVAGLYLLDFGEFPKSGAKDPSLITFLFFGLIRHNKGLEFLIEAGNALANRARGFRVLIAGECKEIVDYRSMVRYPEVFDLRFGMIPNSDIPKLFSEADCLVLPYRDVTQSGPLMIALRYGLPIIASDLPGFREYIVPGETGYLVEPCNADALCGAMAKVLFLSTKERQQMRTNISSYCKQQISLEKIVESYRCFFESVSEPP